MPQESLEIILQPDAFSMLEEPLCDQHVNISSIATLA